MRTTLDQVKLRDEGSVSISGFREDGQIMLIEVSDGIAKYYIRGEYGGPLKILQPRSQAPQETPPPSVEIPF